MSVTTEPTIITSTPPTASTTNTVSTTPPTSTTTNSPSSSQSSPTSSSLSLTSSSSSTTANQQTTTTAGPPTTVTPTTTATAPPFPIGGNSFGLNSNQIAGIVLGAVGFVLLLVALVVLLRKWLMKRKTAGLAAAAGRNQYVTPPSGRSASMFISSSEGPQRTPTPPMGVSATASYADPRRVRQAAERAERAERPERDEMAQIGPDIIANNLDDNNALNIHNLGGNANANANDSEVSPTSSGQTGSNEVRIVIQPARSSRSPNVAGSGSSRALQRQWPMPPGHLGPAVSMFMEDTGTATNTRANTVAGTDDDREGPQPYDPTAWSTASEFGGSVTPETQQQYLQYQRYVRQEEERERLQALQSMQSLAPGGLQPPPSLPLPQPPQLPPSGLSTRRASGVPSSAVLGAGQQWGSAYGFYGDDGNNNNNNGGGGTSSSRDRSQRSTRSNRSNEILPSRPSDERQNSSNGSDNTQTGGTGTGSRRNRFNFGSIGYGRAL